jgi:hypothetical protein
MGQSPSSEAYSCLASHEILSTLRNAKVHYRHYTGPLLVPILNQMNAAQTHSHLQGDSKLS